MKPSGIRLVSIDIFRAFIMFLMIFVNDLRTLTGVPKWLEHAPADVDFLGFADIVFPAFLFIVGMSIPFAVQNRLDKGQTQLQIVKHILFRSLALLIMGVFTVNSPSVNGAATGINPHWFEILMVTGFFLIWNVYPKEGGSRKYFFYGLQALGLAILIFLALNYRGIDHQGNLMYFKPQWWGILGLIGWAYLFSALLYLFFRHNLVLLICCWLFFLGFTFIGHAGLVGKKELFVGNGAFQAFVFAGILITMLYKKFLPKTTVSKFSALLAVIGIILLAAGFASRKFFIISKIHATPPWILICSSISVFLFLIVYLLVDIKQKQKWFSLIKPAGTATLTCYLIPYLFYSFAALYKFALPHWLTHGVIGILKSILFSFLIIGFTYFIGKFKVKLKI